MPCSKLKYCNTSRHNECLEHFYSAITKRQRGQNTPLPNVSTASGVAHTANVSPEALFVQEAFKQNQHTENEGTYNHGGIWTIWAKEKFLQICPLCYF